MFRTDAPGNDGGQYTEGNPALGIPATVVSDDHMNAFQEEISGVIEDTGAVLDKLDNTQLLVAINALISGAGSAGSKQALTNDAGPIDITFLSFDSANFKGAIFDFDIARRTDTGANQRNESGTGRVTFDPDAATWGIVIESEKDESGFADAEVTFNITAAGQVQYTTTDLTGANYSGDLRIAGLKKFSD